MNINRTKHKLPGKKTSHRVSVQKSLLLELIRNNSLTTTPAKARIVVAEFDRLITEAKKETEASKRRVMGKLQSEVAVTKLYSKIMPELGDVNSGYTYQARTLPRKGDNADQIIVLVRGQEVGAKASKLERLLAKQEDTEKPKQRKQSGRTESRRDGGRAANRGGKKVESLADTRRVST